ncbi:MAG: hypothetical protein EDR02_16435 [Actinobacteria bacterium]|nr:MAG: hypothetical protein EDR02_16435 [Actinomycetota bacterium]RIK08383.1 MAG: hypothetical protein DCC48_00040 [Acidobacteriota bacterium]
MGQHCDIVVIGARPGCATIAALLTEAGLKVLLAEMNDRAGGKAMTLHRQGYGCFDLPAGEHIVKQETYTTRSVSNLTRDAVVPGAGGECIGIAQTMEQEGRNKPDPRTPLRGLFIVGCDAGSKGVATHQAVDSGFRVADLVLDDLGVAPRR